MYGKALGCLLAVAVTGCSVLDRSRESSGGETLSWYCTRHDDGGQHCERRRLRDGRPADDVIYDTLIIPAEAPAPAETAVAVTAPETPAPAAGQAKRWDRNPLTAVNSVGDTSALEVENLGPVLKAPRQTIDMWEKHRRDRAPDKGEQGQPADDTADTGNEERTGEAADGGYTIQLAAFTTAEQARAFMAREVYSDLALEERRIFSRGQPWWIVTHGSFTRYGEARAAAEAMAGRYGGVKPWARSLSRLAKLNRP